MSVSDSLSALERARQFELEGKAFFLEAAKKSKNATARKMFETLAGEEELHIRKINEVFNDLKEQNKWTQRVTLVAGTERIERVFVEALKNIDKIVKGDEDDLAVLKKAMDLEERGKVFYETESARSGDALERRFFLTLAQEERGHYLMLLDSYDYLSDPQNWMATHEHPSLDAG